MFGSALKELESEYQGERNELKTRPQARKKGFNHSTSQIS